MANNRLYRSTEADAYIASVRRICDDLGVAKQVGDLRVRMVVYRPIKSGDLDNRLKIVLDALQEIVYTNDKQIVQIHAWRADDKANPRVEIEIDGAA